MINKKPQTTQYISESVLFDEKLLGNFGGRTGWKSGKEGKYSKYIEELSKKRITNYINSY